LECRCIGETAHSKEKVIPKKNCVLTEQEVKVKSDSTRGEMNAIHKLQITKSKQQQWAMYRNTRETAEPEKYRMGRGRKACFDTISWRDLK
jgi:hypothetical protein